MNRQGRPKWHFACAGLILALYGVAELHAAVRMKVRLLTPVSSYHSKPGDPIEALVVPPACREPIDEFPSETVLTGKVRSVKRVGLGVVHETASMRLAFTELQIPGNGPQQIESRLLAIDNARERVDRKGAIHGIRATASLSSRLGEHIAIEAFEHPLLLGPALILESGLLRFPDPEIEYGRGTELSLEVTLPDSVPAPACPSVHQAASGEAADGLGKLVAQLPAWSFSKRQPQPMDLINLVFVGSRPAVESAFAAAGWTGARPNSVAAGLGSIRAIAEEHEYAFGPMRTLLLSGDEADLSFQTELNTFEKRDHLRIWEQREDWEGHPIWASAATRDLGATFSMGHPFGFTHEIQNNLDLERDKVVGDLQLTGCVDSVDYVTRAPGEWTKSRKGVYTDSRIAVITLNRCDAPTADFSEISTEAQPALAVRLVRRVTLTTRNHFLRDNIVWRSGDAARIGVEALHHWYVRRKEERQAVIDARQIAAP